MPVYITNKGIGKETEFKGFHGNYIYYMAGVALGSFFLFIFLYLIGIPALISTLVVVIVFFAGITYLYRLNKKYGLHGLVQRRAKERRPKYINAQVSPFMRINTDHAKKI